MTGISQEQLVSLSRQAGVEQRHVDETAAGDGQVLEGDFVLKRHHSGILVHASTWPLPATISLNSDWCARRELMRSASGQTIDADLEQNF